MLRRLNIRWQYGYTDEIPLEYSAILREQNENKFTRSLCIIACFIDLCVITMLRRLNIRWQDGYTDEIALEYSVILREQDESKLTGSLCIIACFIDLGGDFFLLIFFFNIFNIRWQHG